MQPCNLHFIKLQTDEPLVWRKPLLKGFLHFLVSFAELMQRSLCVNIKYSEASMYRSGSDFPRPDHLFITT
jgi:hypothetical protein